MTSQSQVFRRTA